MDCPEHRRRIIRFALTNISISCNVEMTVRTTNMNVFTRTAQEGTSTASTEHRFQRCSCTSLSAYASLLSSFMAFVWGRLLALIIRKNDAMSRLTKNYGVGVLVAFHDVLVGYIVQVGMGVREGVEVVVGVSVGRKDGSPSQGRKRMILFASSEPSISHRCNSNRLLSP